MTSYRRVQIIFAGLLVLVLVLVGFLLLRQGSVPSRVTSLPVVAQDNPDANQIVVTLFAQTAIAKANVNVVVTNNVQINVTIPAIDAPTVTVQYVFPRDRAERMLASALNDLRNQNQGSLKIPNQVQIVQYYFGTNPHANFYNGKTDEVWCILVSPYLVTEQFRDGAVVHDEVILKRTGGQWDLAPTDKGQANWNVGVDTASFAQYGCTHN